MRQPENANRLENSQRAERVNVGGVLWDFERDRDVALSPEVVDLVGLSLLDNPNEVRGVAKVAVVQEKAHIRLVRVPVELVDARRVEGGRTAFQAVDDVALVEQELRQIGSILAL